MARKKRDEIQKFEKLYHMSNEDLLNEMEAAMSPENVEKLEPDYVAACLKILQERGRAAEEFDQRQEQKVPPLAPKQDEEPKHSRGGRLKLLRALEIAAVLVILLAAVASAGGFNLMDWLRSTNADTVTFIAEPSGVMTMTPEEATQQEDAFTSLQEALDAYGVTEPTSPTWIPEDFHLEMIQAEKTQTMFWFWSYYESETRGPRGNVKVQYTEMTSTMTMTSEIEPDGELYEYKDINYYLFRNGDQCKCHWMQGGFLCTISGDVTFDELKQMIRSMDPE